MNEAEILIHKKNLVIAVPSHGAYDLQGQLPKPSPKSLDRVNAAFALYNESRNSGIYENVSVVFIGGWRGNNKPSTAELMSDAFRDLFKSDTDDIALTPVSTYILGNSKETRRNLEELYEFLNTRFNPENTDIQIISQAYHNSRGRLDRLAQNLLGDFAKKSQFLSVEEIEIENPERFQYAPELKRSASMAELVHILFVETGYILDQLINKEFTIEKTFYDGIDFLRRGSHYINSFAANLRRMPTDRNNTKRKNRSS